METPVLSPSLVEMVEKSGNKIVMIIDEWDAPIRENPDISQEYLEFLRSIFKNSGATAKTFALAYMTGILPIKKDGSQSAISDFHEYTMLEPLEFAQYFGFTEKEVAMLCEQNKLDFTSAKFWYDGYTVGPVHSMYNPYSVMCAIKAHRFRSYWKKTSAAETLMTYIDMNQNGLQEDVAKLVTGESVEVDTDSFQNEVTSFESKDDVLTLLIHLGYLTYEETCHSDEEPVGYARIPNEEVRLEFENILRKYANRNMLQYFTIMSKACGTS